MNNTITFRIEMGINSLISQNIGRHHYTQLLEQEYSFYKNIIQDGIQELT